MFNYAIPQAQQGIAAGQAGLGSAASYFQSLLSGNRTALTQAAAPEINAVNTGADAARRQAAASGTARGGGTASQNANAATTTRAQIDNALLGVRGNAATNLAKTSEAQAGIGENLLTTGASAASDLTASAVKSQQQSDANNAALGQGIGELLASAFAFA